MTIDINDLAHEIADSFGAKRYREDWNRLREHCDLMSGGELETFTLDALTDATQRKARKVWEPREERLDLGSWVVVEDARLAAEKRRRLLRAHA